MKDLVLHNILILKNSAMQNSVILFSKSPSSNTLNQKALFI